MSMAENISPPLSSSGPPPTHIASLQSQEPPLLRSSPPPPPPPPTFSTSPSLSYNHSSRKRQNYHLLETEDALPSSDPAYFSSDDIANACAENYTVERKKRRYRGSWWEHHHQYHHDHALARVHHEIVTGDGEISVKKQQQQQQQPKSKGFSRNFDSGVWMGSDDSEEQFDDRGLQEGEKEENARSNFSFSQNKDEFFGDFKALSDFNGERKQHVLKESKGVGHIGQRGEELSAEEKFASEIIASCLEHGNTSVDLS